MKHTELFFDFSNSIKLIEEIMAVKNGIITSEDFKKGYQINLLKIHNGIHFNLLFDSIMFKFDKWDYRDLEIINDQLKIKIPFLYLESQTFGQQAIGEIPSFELLEFESSKSAYHRLMMPINSDVNFTFSIENVVVEYCCKNKRPSTRNAIEIVINDITFHLIKIKCEYEKGDKEFLILDCQSELNYSDFSDYCFSILVSFGYISGNFINEDGYFFQYDNQERSNITGLKYNKLRGSIKCPYVPIYSNPNGYIHQNEIADLYKNKLRTIKLEEFSKLCELSHTNTDFKFILLLLIEVHTQSLLSGPGILSIVLETISNVIYSENEPRLAPIKSKPVLKKITNEFLHILETYKDDIDKDGMKIIENKISQINQRTNRDKLLIPFNLLNIPINDRDVDAIDQRNAFLHGRDPIVQEVEAKTVLESDKLRYYLFLKLYVLISSIILKYVGYDSLIVNYPKIYEDWTTITLDEEHYRQI